MKERTRPGVMIYFEDFDAITDDMTDEEVGRFVRYIVNYAKSGELPDFTKDPMMKMPFRIIRPRIDRDGERYEQQKIHGQYMVYVRKAKAAGEIPMDEETWKLSVTNSYCTLPSTSTSPSTFPSTSTSQVIHSTATADHRVLTDSQRELLEFAEECRRR